MTWIARKIPKWLDIGTADPYLISAQATKFADYDLPQPAASYPLFAVVLHWSNEDKASAEHLLRSLALPDRVCLAHVNLHMNYATADLTYRTLIRLSKRKSPKLNIELAAHLRANRVLRRVAAPSTAAVPSPGIPGPLLIGIIDHGCPFAHEALRVAGSVQTRIAAIWDQDLDPDFADFGSPPEGFGYGRQVEACALNHLMASSIETTTGRLDEAKCYRLAGYDAMRFRASHGAVVLDLMAGKTPSRSLVADTLSTHPRDQAATAPVVFVQLPRQTIQAPSGPAIERAILDGLRYIVDRAEDGARVVVPIDYGSYLGAHNGETTFDSAIEQLVAHAATRSIKLDVVFPSGNAREDGAHAEINRLKAGQRARVALWAPPGNGVPIFWEAWLPADVGALNLSFSAPDRSQFVLSAPGIHVWPSRRHPSAAVVAQRIHTRLGEFTRVLVRLAPTEIDGGSATTAPSGRWLMEVEPSKEFAGCGHVYASFGHPNMGARKRSVQPRLIPLERARLDGDASVNGSALCNKVWVIGGFVRQTRLPARYSSCGPATGGMRANFNVDAFAISDESSIRPGVVGITNTSGGSVRVVGTSVAAPQAARELAEFDWLKPAYSSVTGTSTKARLEPGRQPGDTKSDELRFLDYYQAIRW